MKKVKRGDIPGSLRRNAAKWTKDLLRAINKSKKSGESVPHKYYDRYRKADVKKALINIYGVGDFTYCCYCESVINDVSFEHIEHRMPKNQSPQKYPKQAFEWKNLHLSCGKCNEYKGTQYDEINPILDATKNPIKKHLGYELSNTNGVYRETLSDRGATTVEHAGLDRPQLRTARLTVWIETIKAIDIIRELGDDPRVYTKINMLRDLTKQEHGSLVEYLLDKHKVGTAQ